MVVVVVVVVVLCDNGIPSFWSVTSSRSRDIFCAAVTYSCDCDGHLRCFDVL